jgi:hypothetical protein
MSPDLGMADPITFAVVKAALDTSPTRWPTR